MSSDTLDNRPASLRLAEARGIIQRYAIGAVFTAADTERFSGLCGYTFERVQRVAPLKGTGASVRVTCRGEQYEGRWSWVKSIEGYDYRKNLRQAMRRASAEGSFSGVAKTVCRQCGARERLCVDHKSTPFSAIAADFVAQFGQPAIENGGDGWRLVEPDVFTRFHDAIADYQVLCVSCNARKGAKAEIDRPPSGGPVQ